jgi:hypothetical protein
MPAIPAGTTLSVGVAHWLKILANQEIYGDQNRQYNTVLH